MTGLSINMACFDFIVTSDGDYVFLELNQQGQFLWVEELCESICMLDEFVSFLERTHSPHEPPSSGKGMSFNEAVSSPQYAEYKEIFETHGYVNIN